MDANTFIRRPFVVEAIRITPENIEELAPEVGTLEHKTDGTPYIKVDRNKVPAVFKVWVGYWLTRMNGNVRCYSSKVFKEQFTEATEEGMAWVAYMNTHQEPSEVVETTPSEELPQVATEEPETVTDPSLITEDV